MAKKKAAKSAQERRQAKRVPVNMWVREERADYYFLYKATDISEGGIFLEKKIETPSSKVISTFKFTLPKSSRLITADGLVMFTNTSTQNDKVGSGVKFIQISNADKKLLTKFIRQN